MTAILEHFHEVVNTPEDVEKVKKYILQLAMQGELVEQDPHDETASEILKKISEEKQRLIKEKKLKKTKPLPPLSDEESLYELPNNWKWIRLGDISKNIHYGHTASATTENTGVKFVRITDIQDSRVIWGNVPYCGIDEKKLSDLVLSNNDILIARTGGTIGKSFIVENIEQTAVFASYLIRVVLFEENFPKYIKLFLESDLYWNQIASKSQGTGQPNVNAVSLANLVMPLPPINEQKRIFNKVNELFEQCDQLVVNLVKKQTTSALLNKSVFTRIQNHINPEQMNDLLFAVKNIEHLCNDKESIDQLRNAILTLAVQGKLVEQDVNNRPASMLVEKIKEEKDRLLAEKKIKKEKQLPTIRDEDIPFKLPQGWEWVRLGDITTKLGAGKTPSGGQKGYVQKGVKFIRSQNVWNDGLLLEGIAHITPETHESMSGSAVQPKDILLNITGASIGRSSLVPDNFDTANVNQHVAIIRLVEENTRHYIHTCITSPYFQSEVMRVQVGASREGLSMAKLEKFIIPLPPLEEQIRIMEKVKTLINLINFYENQVIKKDYSTKSFFQSLITNII
ncbi:restriction endonuclease subunit S [Niallia sp. 03133]|uniref:restriction endonuclease subunit S n=1 Tax=Niallia sp. 03133 TaxID=3458060 RepID=UPI004044841E